MRSSKVNPIAGLALSIALQSAALAASSPAVLGHSGQLQRALTGTYGELFSEGEALDAATPVLVVEIVSAGHEAARFLVPGTEDSRVEAEPILFQDGKYDTFVLLWQSRAEESASQVRFAIFDGSEWSQVHTLEHDGAPVEVAGAPSIAESHDTFEVDLEGGEPLSAERRILHVIWQSEGPSPATYYAPLNFIEGQYLGWHALLTLDATFLQEPEADSDDAEAGGSDDDSSDSETETGEEPIQLAASLSRTLLLQTAGDDRSILVTFANPASHRIGTVEISPLPLAMGLLGEQVREQILALAEFYDPDNLASFSDQIRAGIVIMGSIFNLHEAYGDYVADEVADWLLSAGELYGWDLESLGNDARDLTIDVSNEVYASTKTDPADPDSEIIEIDVAGLIGDEPDPAQTLDMRVRADLPAPAIGDGPTTVYTSRDGRGLLIAWQDEEAGRIHWRESRRDPEGSTWSEAFSLELGDHLTLEEAHALLAAKIR